MNRPVLSDLQFPNISRSFTELTRERKLFYFKIFAFSFVTTFLLVSIMLRGYELFEGFQILHVASAQRQEVETERGYWQEVAKKHPGYRDAYFKLAVLSYQLGEKEQAKGYLQEAMTIDRNFKEGLDFAKKVGL